jgi:hypothetical protein
MRRSLAAPIIAFGLAIGQVANAMAPQQDPYLTAYYSENEKVLCRDYQTANGARFATFQWWVLGFVSGADHVRRTLTSNGSRRCGSRASVGLRPL